MKQRIHFLVGATLLLTAVLAGCGSKEGKQPPAWALHRRRPKWMW